MTVRFVGSTSGYVDVNAPAIAGTTTITLPASSGTLVVTGGTAPVQFPAGNVTNPSITSNVSSTAGIWFPAANTIAISTSSVEAFRVDTSGYIGIGNTSPSAPIDVTAPTGSVAVKVRGRASDNISAIVFDNNTGNAGTQVNFISSLTNSYLVFATNNTERMRIDSSGNISASSPTSRLSGQNQDAAYLTTSGTVATLLLGDTGSGANGIFRYDRSGGGILVRAGGANGVSLSASATAWAAVSDEATKDIIEPISDAATKVSSLRAVIGKYKTDSDGTRRSFLIAQDVKKVLPEAVSEIPMENSGPVLGLSYSDVIPLLVAAIKEQQITIASLEARITALENV